jgi:hypothetical protein
MAYQPINAVSVIAYEEIFHKLYMQIQTSELMESFCIYINLHCTRIYRYYNILQRFACPYLV